MCLPESLFPDLEVVWTGVPLSDFLAGLSHPVSGPLPPLLGRLIFLTRLDLPGTRSSGGLEGFDFAIRFIVDLRNLGDRKKL